jgi:hypothetical protein
MPHAFYGGVRSIPDVAWVEIDSVDFQEPQVFVLEGLGLMVSLLVLNAGNGAWNLGGANGECRIPHLRPYGTNSVCANLQVRSYPHFEAELKFGTF